MPHHDTRSHDSILPASRRTRPIAALVLTCVLLTSCSAAGAGTLVDGDVEDTRAESSDTSSGFIASSVVHGISMTFDAAEYDAMIDAYETTGDKEWISADVTIDDVTYIDVGVRLKGNSSLGGLRSDERGGPGGGASADEPEALPWLIRLDKYVDGQNHEGISDLVVRSNTTQTSLNEAVALDLLELAGLASQDTAYARFSVNGSEEVLRLVVENPDDVWLADAFVDDGVLYKAESTGDYSYRGDDPDAYDEVFDIEAGATNGDLAPLIDFLDFINTADDATFDEELPDRFDVAAFATYLAMQELIDNFDDIDGPGNNSYLYVDVDTGVFTIVPWDHNLAFGGPGFGGGDGEPGGTGPRRGFGDDASAPPGGAALPQDRPGGGASRSNVLVERFLANDDWRALYERALSTLEASLFTSGVADDVLDSWANLLTTTAADLVDEDVVSREAASIAAYFS